jgi:hypothetical protein
MRTCLSPRLLPLLLSSALLVSPALSAAQSFETRRAFWEFSPQMGFFVPEEPEQTEIEAGPLFGARASYRRAAGFGFEIHGGYTPLELELAGNPSVVLDLPTFIYGGDVLYFWALDPRSDVFVSTGLGGITWNPDGEEADDSETNVRASFGAGIHYLIGSRIAMRGDVRDHIIFDQLADTARPLAIADRGNTNNLEGSIGVSVVLP